MSAGTRRGGSVNIGDYLIFIVLIALIAFFSFYVEAFRSSVNLINILRQEVAPLLQALDQEAQQARPAVGADGLSPGYIPGLSLFAQAGVVGIKRHEGVVDALSGVEAGFLVGQLAKDLFSVGHGASSSLSGGAETLQPRGDCQVSAVAPAEVGGGA